MDGSTWYLLNVKARAYTSKKVVVVVLLFSFGAARGLQAVESNRNLGMRLIFCRSAWLSPLPLQWHGSSET